MSAFGRLPKDYLDACTLYSRHMGRFEGVPPRPKKLSPQNRRVRFAVDLALARAKSFPNNVTRQQRRSHRRLGLPVPG